MATLKDHQKAMVDLLANGSAIPASAARLAHALHDVLGLLLELDSEPHRRVGGFVDSTETYVVGETPLEAKLAADLDVSKPKHGDSVKTINLRAELANITNQRNTYKARCESLEADIDGHTCDYEAVVLERDKLKGVYDTVCEKWLEVDGKHGALIDACIGMGLEPMDMINKEMAK